MNVFQSGNGLFLVDIGAVLVGIVGCIEFKELPGKFSGVGTLEENFFMCWDCTD